MSREHSLLACQLFIDVISNLVRRQAQQIGRCDHEFAAAQALILGHVEQHEAHHQLAIRATPGTSGDHRIGTPGLPGAGVDLV